MLLDLSKFKPNHKINSILNGLFSLEETIHSKKENFKALLEEINQQYPNYSLTTQTIINSFLGYLDAKMTAHTYEDEGLTPMSFETKISKAFEQERIAGIQAGIQQGELRKAIETAKVMLRDNLNKEIVSKYTGLTLKQMIEFKLIKP